MKYSFPKNTWVEASCYITEELKCIYQQQIGCFIAQVCYHWQLQLLSRFKTVQESLHGCVIVLGTYIPLI